MTDQLLFPSDLGNVDDGRWELIWAMAPVRHGDRAGTRRGVYALVAWRTLLERIVPLLCRTV